MVPEQLSGYIREQLTASVSKEDIIRALLAVGWQPSDVHEAFTVIEAVLPRVPTPTNVPFTAPVTVSPISTATPKRHLAPLFIAVGCLLLVLGGGVYVYENKKAEVPVASTPITPVTTPEPISQTLPIEPTAKSSVVIIATESVFGQLSPELTQLATDIKNDLNVETFIEHRNYSNAAEVRALIKQYYASKNLLGSVLVGDVPYATVENFASTGGFTGNASYPSDAYYQDLDDQLWTDFNHNGLLDARAGLAAPLMHKEVWSGRIKPTETGDKGIDQLRQYLKRDHEYRTSPLPSITKTLFYDATYRDSVGSSSTMQNFRDWLQNMANNVGIYTSSDTSVPYLSSSSFDYVNISDAQTEKADYISKLKNNQYDLVYTNVHGSNSLIQIASGAEITNQDIKNIQSQSHFYIMASCGTGRFSDRSYYSGELIFNGRGLGSYAFTEPVAISGSQSILGVDFLNGYAPLRLGATWGDIIRQDSAPLTVFIGDPTLRLRNVSTSDLSWQVSQPLITQIKLGEKKTVFRITNNGSSTLFIANAGNPTGYVSVNDKIYTNEYSKNQYPAIAANQNYNTTGPSLSGYPLPSNEDINSKGIFVQAPDGRIITGYKILGKQSLDFIVDLINPQFKHKVTQDEEILRIFQTNDPRRPFIELRAKIKVSP